MSPGGARGLIYAALFLAFLLRHDLWLWRDARLISGIPASLLYHVGFCLAASVLMLLLVTRAWPEDLDRGSRDGPGR